VPLDACRRAQSPAKGFSGGLISPAVGAVGINVSGTGVSVHRTSRRILCSDPGYVKVGVALRGSGAVAQDDRSTVLATGAFALYDTSRPYHLDFDGSFAMFVLMLPRESLRCGQRALSEVMASRFSGRRRLGAVTTHPFGELGRQLQLGAIDPPPPLADAIVDLLSASVTNSR